MNSQQIRARLWDSLELQVLWARFLISAIFIAVFILFCGITRRNDYLNTWAVAGIIGGISLAPLLIFCTIRTFRIFRKAESYIFCRTRLTQPHSGPIRDTIYFTALFEDPSDGSKFPVDTHAIFATRGLLPRMDDYANATVTLAYNQETEMVVVIG